MALGGFFAVVGALPLGIWIYATGTPLGGLENTLPLLFNELLYLASMWIYLIGKEERRGFVLGLRTRLKVQAVSEIACLLGDVGLCYFLLVFPVAFVQAISCMQPLFVLVAAFLLTRLFPKAIAEEVRGLTLAQKAVGVALMVAGGIVLSV